VRIFVAHCFLPEIRSCLRVAASRGGPSMARGRNFSSCALRSAILPRATIDSRKSPHGARPWTYVFQIRHLRFGIWAGFPFLSVKASVGQLQNFNHPRQAFSKLRADLCGRDFQHVNPTNNPSRRWQMTKTWRSGYSCQMRATSRPSHPGVNSHVPLTPAGKPAFGDGLSHHF